MLDRIEMKLRHGVTGELFPVYIDVHDNGLSHKWLSALNNIHYFVTELKAYYKQLANYTQNY